MSEHRASKLTLVAATSNEARARIVCEELRARGIKCGTVFGRDPRLRGRGIWALFNIARRVTAPHPSVWLVYIDPTDATRAQGVVDALADPDSDVPDAHTPTPY